MLEHTLRNKIIKNVACGLWEEAGKPQGRDLEFWFKAEKMLLQSISEEHKEFVEKSAKSTTFYYPWAWHTPGARANTN